MDEDLKLMSNISRVRADDSLPGRSIRIRLTGNKENLFITVRTGNISNWETLIKKGQDVQDQSRKLFGLQAVDHSSIFVTQDGDIVLDSTRVYSHPQIINRESHLFIGLIGCKKDVKAGQSGRVVLASVIEVLHTAKKTTSFPDPADLTWTCEF